MSLCWNKSELHKGLHAGLFEASCKSRELGVVLASPDSRNEVNESMRIFIFWVKALLPCQLRLNLHRKMIRVNRPEARGRPPTGPGCMLHTVTWANYLSSVPLSEFHP